MRFRRLRGVDAGIVFALQAWAVSPVHRAVALPESLARRGPLPVLVVVNLGLQLADGLATCAGVARGAAEGNLFLRFFFPYLGVAGAVGLFKLAASALVLAVAAIGPRHLATVGLGVTALFYVFFAFVPWALVLS